MISLDTFSAEAALQIGSTTPWARLRALAARSAGQTLRGTKNGSRARAGAPARLGRATKTRV
jgi:hypothetical protein